MFDIADRPVGTGHPCFIIGEVAQAHDGSLGMAHAYIDAIADAGADAVKFQTHIAAEESTPDEMWRVKFSYQDDSRFDYWRRMEFTEAQWRGLADHAGEKGLVFLSSPFSVAAVELLARIGVPAWKIASGEIGNVPLVDAIAKTGWPVMLSSGMSSLAEIDAAVERLKGHGLEVALLQCYSAYPCPPEKVGLNMIAAFRDRYGCPAGLSDHSGTIYPGLACAAQGGDLLEVHVTMSREMFGPDVVASVTTAELRQLVDGVRFIERMLANPVAKDDCAGELAEMRQLFFKSVVAREDLSAGTVIELRHVTVKKPGTGIPADAIATVIGRRLKTDVEKDKLLRDGDLD